MAAFEANEAKVAERLAAMGIYPDEVDDETYEMYAQDVGEIIDEERMEAAVAEEPRDTLTPSLFGDGAPFGP